MAAETQTSVIRTESQLAGFSESISGARELDAAFTGVSESSKKISGAVISVQGQLDRLDAKYDASIKTANEVARVQGLISAAREQGGQDEEQYARLLSAALAAHEAALNKLSGTANDNTQATARMAAEGRNATESLRAQTSAVQGLINAWAGVKPTGLDTATRAADIRAYSDALDGLSAKFNPMVAAEQKLARETAELNTAFANFEINILDLERGLEQANAAFQKSAAAVRNYYTEIETAAAKAAAAAQQKIHTQVFGVPKRADDDFFQNRQDDLNAYGDALDDLHARVSPLYAAEREFARAVGEADLALKSQLITADEHGAALKRLESNYDRMKSAIHGTGNAAASGSKNFGLASHQLQNLSFQLNDLVVQMGSGGGIFRPLLQQGAQVLQILEMSEGGVGGVLTKVAGKMKEMGPAAVAGWGAAGLAIGAVVATTALAIKAQIDYREELLKTQRATTAGPGRMSGIQGGDIEEAAQKASKASQGLSTGDLRDVALEYARLGTIGKNVMSDLTGVTERYAETLGIDTAQAIKELGAAFADPAKGAAFLAERLNFLSGAQLEYIMTLARTEGRVSAQGQLMRDLAKGPMVNLETQIVTLDAAWTAFWKNVEKGADIVVRSIAKIGAPKDLQQQLAEVEARIKAIADAKAKALEEGTQGDLGGFGVQSRGTFGGAPDPDADRQKAFAEAARLRMQIEKQAQDSAEAGFLKTAREADELVRHLDPIGSQFVELQKQAKLLEDALRMPDKLANVDATNAALERLKASMGGATTVAEAHVVALDRAAAAHQNALAAIQAVTLEQQQAVAAETARAQAVANGLSPDEQALAMLRARQLVLAQANATTQQQLAQGALVAQQIQVETQATLAQTDAERQAAVQAQAKLAYMQAEAAALAAGRGEVNARMEAEMAYNQVIQQGNAARAIRLQSIDQEIAAGAREAAQRQLNIQSQNAYTAAEQQAAAAAQAEAAAEEAKRDALARGATPKQAAIKAEQAHAKVMEEFEGKVDAAVKAADRLIRANELQLRAINATTVAARAKIAAEQSMLDTENSLMTMTQRLTIAEQERQKVLQQAEASVRQMIVAQEGQLHLLEASISSIGMERAAREALLAGIRAENELRQMGIDIGSASAQQYIRNAEAIGSMTVELERAEAAQRRLTSATEAYGRTAGRTILGASEATWRGQMDTLNQALAGGGGFQAVEAASPLRTAEATVKAHNKAVEAAQASEEAAKAAADAAKASKDAVDNLDTSAIGTEIDRLRSLQEAALSRAYRPDPYAEKNPEFFYNGEQIMKAAQDKIFDGLQTQIEKLQGLQASIGTLIAQGAQLPQTLVNALIAAGFGNIARDIADALTPTSIASATPNPTSVMWTLDDVLPEGAARQPIYKEFVTRGIMGSAVSVNRIYYGRQ